MPILIQPKNVSNSYMNIDTDNIDEGPQNTQKSVVGGSTWLISATDAMTSDSNLPSFLMSHAADVDISTPVAPRDIAMYYLLRSAEDGDLITPLKMQKLVYYAYAWTLVLNEKCLFQEQMEAWANGPVIPSLYAQLKPYGASPIGIEFAGVSTQRVFEKLSEKIAPEIRETLDEVYETYMPKSAFELVVLTHNEKPWIEARGGLPATSPSNNPISDTDIKAQYVPL